MHSPRKWAESVSAVTSRLIRPHRVSGGRCEQRLSAPVWLNREIREMWFTSFQQLMGESLTFHSRLPPNFHAEVRKDNDVTRRTERKDSLALSWSDPDTEWGAQLERGGGRCEGGESWHQLEGGLVWRRIKNTWRVMKEGTSSRGNYSYAVPCQIQSHIPVTQPSSRPATSTDSRPWLTILNCVGGRKQT